MKTTFTLLLILLSLTGLKAQKIWRGPTITFSKANNANVSLAANQDRITDTIWITRAASQGIYNIKTETGYTGSSSPSNTEWSYGLIQDWNTLTYTDWESTNGSNPPSMVNRDMVMHLISDSIYIGIKFTAWTQNAAGGGFTYQRTTCESESTVNISACGSFLSPSGNYTWTEPGTYKDTITNSNGCDSFMTINLSLTNYLSFSTTVCDSFAMFSKSEYWTTSGIYSDTLVGMASCASADSILIINLTILKTERETRNEIVCNSYTSPSGNHTWTTSGTYHDTVPNGFCDSIYTINLVVNNSQTASIAPTACNSYTSPSGNYTWSNSGNYTDTIQTTTGCDSILLINLTINRDQSRFIFESACDSYISPSGNHTWTSSGIYSDTIPTFLGCDSLLTINLTIKNRTSSNLNISTCESSYLSPSGNYTWTTPNTYFDTILNQAGCDSFMTIDLSFSSPTSSTISETACKSYTSPSGRYIWSSSNTYSDTVQNAKGCDSVITINLTINNANASFQKQGNNFVANATGANYQWMNCASGFTPIMGETNMLFSATSTGSYALEITENNCTDTSSCYVLGSLDIKSLGLGESTTINPNPTSGEFKISLANTHKKLDVSIFNLLGKEVSSAAYSNVKELKLDLKQPKGIYILRLTAANGETASFRLIKN